MEWVIAFVAVVVIGIAAVAATGRFGQFEPADTDEPQPQWPEGELTSADIDQLGFAVVPRGYAMDQVDEFCDRVKARLAELEGDFADDDFGSDFALSDEVDSPPSASEDEDRRPAGRPVAAGSAVGGSRRAPGQRPRRLPAAWR